MSQFTHLMLHTTQTPVGRVVTYDDLHKWHIQERGWSRVGYSAGFQPTGEMNIMIPFDKDDVIESWEISNGASGWNGRTRHWFLAGPGKSLDGYTSEQMAALGAAMKLHVQVWPDVKFIGHNQVNRFKSFCPGFSVADFCERIGIPEANIDRGIYFKRQFN